MTAGGIVGEKTKTASFGTVTANVALSAGSATDVAVIFTVSNAGAGGATNVACVGVGPRNVPQPCVVPVQDPLALHVTPRPVGSLITVAENCADVSGTTVVLEGPVIWTYTGKTVRVSDAEMLELVVEVAVIVTLIVLPGMLTGACLLYTSPSPRDRQ